MFCVDLISASKYDCISYMVTDIFVAKNFFKAKFMDKKLNSRIFCIREK